VNLLLTVTVNASIELVRMDVLPLSGRIPSSLWIDIDENEKRDAITSNEYCLLLVDLRNAWPSNLHVHLDINNKGKVDEEILPGNTSRIVYPIRRIFLESPSAAIPALDPSRQRQFVVSTGGVSADAERVTREAFWYREEILKIMKATWSTRSGPHRRGDIELRGIRLIPRVIDAIKIDDVGIDISIDTKTMTESLTAYKIHTDRFSEIKIRISNRTPKPICPFLRLQPSIRNHTHSASLDLSKKLILNGVLQQSLSQLAGHGSVEVSIGMIALCRGEFEISASVEEAQLVEPPQESHDGPAGRPRANTKTLMDTILSAKERRIWHTREPCVVVVMDADNSVTCSDDEGS